MDVQTISAIIFILLLTIFLILKRKKLETQKFMFPLLYFSMYRTKFGLKFMEKFSNKFRKPLKYLGYLGVGVCFLGMVFISFLLIQNLYIIFTRPEAVPGVGLVLPFKVKGVFFVPFFYWIIAIFTIAIVHEFAHGILGKTHDMKIKSSGFAFLAVFLPIIPAAFVEPDEKQLMKRPVKQQLSVFAAGPFANIAFAFLIIIIFQILFVPLFVNFNEPNGVIITEIHNNSNLLDRGVVKGEVITGISGNEIKTLRNLSEQINLYGPGDTVNIITNKARYNTTLIGAPNNSSIPFIGISVEQNTQIREGYEKYSAFNKVLLWFTGDLYKQTTLSSYGLLLWLYMLNLGIGLFNLVPIGPLDGGRMLSLTLQRYFKKEKSQKISYYIGMFFALLVFVNLAFSFIK